MDLPLNPPLRLLAAFHQNFPDYSPDWIVNVSDRDMWLAGFIHNSGQFSLVAPDLEGRTTFDRRSAKSKRTSNNRPLPKWARYAAGAVVRLSSTDLSMPGLSAVIAGEEVPGPRYDYAVGLVMAAVWHDYNQAAYAPDTLVDIMERVRRDYLG